MTNLATVPVHGDHVPRPFLKWVGGKRQLQETLLAIIQELRGAPLLQVPHYYEPFVGGGALFFALRAAGWRGRATLGDSNERLIQTYIGVRNDVDAVIEGLKGARYDKREYLQERARNWDILLEDADYAIRFIYLNKCCFNGLYRVNRKGEFNVPFGRYTNPTICDEIGLRAASRALKHMTLKHGDFEKIVRNAEAGDLVYFDPPYVPASTSADFTAYTRDGFTKLDQERLRDCALRLKRLGVHVILSNSDTPIVRQLYRPSDGFKVRRVEARRSVNSDASKRGAVGELIIT